MIAVRQDQLLLNLTSPKDARFLPRADDRRSWAMIDRSLALELIERAKNAQKLEVRQMNASDVGSDSYKEAYISRVEALKAMCIGACCQGNGAFAPQMTDYIYALCQQPDWSFANDDENAPDYTDSIIDVYACETGALLAFVAVLCQDQLDSVSPRVVNYISHTLKRRIIDPLINWEGVEWRIEGRDMPRAVSALTAVALLGETDDRKRWLCLRRAVNLLDACIKALPEQGGFVDGLENHLTTALALDDCFSLLSAASAGAVELRDEEQFVQMAQSISDVHVSGGWFANPSGFSPYPNLDTDSLFRLGVDARLSSLCALAAYLRRVYGKDPELSGDFSAPTAPIYQQIMNAFRRSDIQRQSARIENGKIIVKRDMPMLLGRMEGFCAAISGCACDESLYSPSVGDIALYLDDEPEIISYSSDKPRLSSVPTINGADQIARRADDIDCVEGAGYVMLSMNIANAYPPKALVGNWQRTVMLASYESSVRLMDVFDLEAPGMVTFRFMLRNTPKISAGLVEAGGIAMQFDPDLAVKCDSLTHEGRQIYRIELFTPSASSSGNYSFVFRRIAGSR